MLGWRFELEPAPAHIEFGERLADFAATLVDRAETAHERDLLIANAPVVLAAIDADGVVTVCEGAAAERIGPGRTCRPALQEALADAPALVARSRRRPTTADGDHREQCAGASSTCGCSRAAAAATWSPPT